MIGKRSETQIQVKSPYDVIHRVVDWLHWAERNSSGRPQHKIDMYCVIRENNPTAVGFIQ
jgi:hypothetical protein